MSAMVHQALRPVRRALEAVRRVGSDPLAYVPDRGRRPTTSPTVGLVGFYGWGNYGDELFWQAFAGHFGPSFTLRNIVGRASQASGPSLQRAVAACDAIVVGGGDIVVPWSPTRYWRTALLRRPVYVAGVGVPLWREPTPDATARLRKFFRHPNVRGIGTRDQPSADWITEHLDPVVPVRVAPDLVCSLPLPAVERPADPPIFGVAVRLRKESIDDFSQVRRLCDRAVALGYRVRQIVLATGETRQADIEATERIGLGGAELVSSDDLAVISRAIGECTVLASMKFHGVVVATMYGIPTIAMMPTTKTRNFLADIDRLDLLSHFVNADLPDLLQPTMRPIDPGIRARLRAGAEASLAGLRSDILAAVGP